MGEGGGSLSFGSGFVVSAAFPGSCLVRLGPDLAPRHIDKQGDPHHLAEDPQLGVAAPEVCLEQLAAVLHQRGIHLGGSGAGQGEGKGSGPRRSLVRRETFSLNGILELSRPLVIPADGIVAGGAQEVGLPLLVRAV